MIAFKTKLYSKRFLVFLLFLITHFSSFRVFAQRTLLPSSNSHKFATAGSASVGSYTGGFNYGVPLFNLSEKDINIRTSITYSSNGVNLNDMQTSVGMNWVLQAGGIISRVIKKQPDEEYNREYKQDTNLGNMNNGCGFYIDTEPDWFSFNVNGLSGEFQFDEDLNILVNSEKNISIEYNENTLLFTLTDENGFIYYFGEENQENVKMIGTGTFFNYNGEVVFHNTSWFLTKIISPSGKEIHFSYIPNEIFYSASRFNSISMKNTCQSNDLEEGEYINTDEINIIDAFLLSEITATNSKIVFDYTYNLTTNFTLLNHIILYSGATSIKECQFTYEQTIATTENSGSMVKYRDYLANISFMSPNNEIGEAYHFDYNNKELLPCRLSYSRDRFGYYNGADNTNKPFSYTEDTAVNNLLSQTLSADNLSYFGADHNVNPETVSYGMLSRITKPLGSYTEIEYEANSDILNGETIYGPGVRVASIVEVGESQEYSRNEYFYNTIDKYPSNDTSLQNTFTNNKDWIMYEYELYEKEGGSTCPNHPIINEYIFTNNLIFTQYKRDLAPYYTAVSIIQKKGETINSVIETKYHEAINSPAESIHGGEVILGTCNSNDGMAYFGLPIEKNLYKYTNNHFQKVKSNHFQYSILDSQVYYSTVFLKHYYFYNSNHEEDYNYPNINVSRYGNYRFITKLTSSTETLFNSENSFITKEKSFTYSGDPFFTLSTTENLDSSGNLVKNIFYHPQDKNSLSGLTVTQKTALDSLVAHHKTALTIQTENFKNGQLLSTQRTNYKDWGENAMGSSNLILPEVTQAVKGEISGNNTLKDRIVYYKYDEYGNPLELAKANNPNHICYIWGFNHSKLIAKIENASYSQIEGILGSDFEISEYFTTRQENQLRSSLSDSMITTYDYYPLIGVKTATQPNGEKKQYEYDSFNRQKFVLDTNGHILIETEYHYKD